MIRVQRGTEPRTLPGIRRRRLKKAIQDWNASQDLALTGYDAPTVKKALYLAQYKKCAWCERRADYSSSPVEHYRPKNGAWRHERGQPAQVDPDHYWWLAWTWENLLFSCPRCNDQGHKANFFQVGTAVAAPTRPLPQPPNYNTPIISTQQENPYFLDPADPAVDPQDQLWWKPVDDSLPPEQWIWSPHWKDDHGRITADNLRLLELADEVQEHIKTRILDRAATIQHFLNQNDLSMAQARWDTLIADHLTNPHADFRGPTYQALIRLFPQPLLTQLQRTLTRP